MNSKRFHWFMIILTCLLGVAILGSLYVANTLLKQQAKKLYDAKLQSQVLDQQQVGLAQAKKDISKFSELEREAKIIVPQDKDQAEAVREIISIAKATGVSVSSVIFPASTLGNTSPSTGTSTGSSTGGAAGSSTVNKPPFSQTQAVPGLKGVYLMPITVQVSNAPVSYTNFVKFLNKLEQNRRTSQVSSINIQPIATNPSKVNFTLIINAYIKP